MIDKFIKTSTSNWQAFSLHRITAIFYLTKHYNKILKRQKNYFYQTFFYWWKRLILTHFWCGLLRFIALQYESLETRPAKNYDWLSGLFKWVIIHVNTIPHHHSCFETAVKLLNFNFLYFFSILALSFNKFIRTCSVFILQKLVSLVLLVIVITFSHLTNFKRFFTQR